MILNLFFTTDPFKYRLNSRFHQAFMDTMWRHRAPPPHKESADHRLKTTDLVFKMKYQITLFYFPISQGKQVPDFLGNRLRPMWHFICIHLTSCRVSIKETQPDIPAYYSIQWYTSNLQRMAGHKTFVGSKPKESTSYWKIAACWLLGEEMVNWRWFC